MALFVRWKVDFPRLKQIKHVFVLIVDVPLLVVHLTLVKKIIHITFPQVPL